MSLTSVKGLNDLKHLLVDQEVRKMSGFEGSGKTLEDLELSDRDVFDVFLLYQQESRFVGHQLESINNFYDVGISMIVTQVFSMDTEIKDVFDPRLDKITVKMVFEKAVLGKPTKYSSSGRQCPLYPLEALRTMNTYSAPLNITIRIKVIGHRKDGGPPMECEAVKQVSARIPVMVGSNRCNLYGKSAEELARLGEDPTGRGGYFILNGVERSLDLQENITFNEFRTFYNRGYKKEWTRCEIISKAGDSYQNSNQTIIRLHVGYQLTVSIMHRLVKDYHIPFFLLYRALGMVRDVDMVRSITSDPEMMQDLDKAMDAKYDKFPNALSATTQQGALEKIALALSTGMEGKSLSYLDLGNKPENMRQAVSTLEWIFDEKLFPHVGTGVGARERKLRYMSLMINRTFKTARDPSMQTDRDAIKNKRLHSAGHSISKVFKTFMYIGIVRPVVDETRRQYGKAAFDAVDLAASVFKKHGGMDIQDEISKMIISGDQNSTSSRRTQNTRVSSQQLRRQNELHTMGILRQISANSRSMTKSKSSSRSNEMRQVQPGMIDRVCVVRSSDGAQIGLTKEQAIFSGITGITMSDCVIEFISETEKEGSDLFTPLDRVSNSDIWAKDLANVFVYGKWVGVTTRPAKFAQKYRDLRRKGHIQSEVAVYWNEIGNTVNFYTDAGRLITPRLVVYNNQRHPEMFPKDHYKKNGFMQSTLLTPDIVQACREGRVNTEWLVRHGVMELLDEAEEENLMLSWGIEEFKKIRSDELQPVTHLRVPAQIMGISAHVNVFGNRNSTVRNTFEGNQSRQTCGMYVRNWMNRIDKSNHVQAVNQIPLVQSPTNFLTPPNGVNSFVALAIYEGHNQEDSQTFNRRSLAVGMHWGVGMYSYTSEKEADEEFRVPDPTCMPFKKANNYDTLGKHGYPEIGTVLHKGDPIIGKVRLVEDGKYMDQSVLYDKGIPGIVRDVIKADNSEGKKFVRVQVTVARPSKQGEKHSSRAGQKGISGYLMPVDRMLYTEDGIIPDTLQTPGSQPSRMTTGQLIEGVLAQYAAENAVTIDGTTFNNVDLEEVEALCMRSCVHQMISGLTGRYIPNRVFMTMLYMQRLQKFLEDQLHVANTGNTNRLTRQGMQGKRLNGGLRLGGMETDVFSAQGSPYAHSEKMRNHSDGYAWALCVTCNKPAVMNTRRRYYACKSCGSAANIKRFETGWTSKLFTQELNGMGVGMRFLTRPSEFQVQETSSSSSRS